MLCLFFLGKELFSKKVGLAAALFYAIQPWSMHISRVGFETNLATFFITLGVLLTVKSRKKIWYLLPAALFFILAMYTYHAARIVSPLLGAFVAILSIQANKQDTRKKVVAIVVSITVAIVCMLPILINMRNPVVAQRAAETSIFSDLSMIKESNLLKEEDSNSLFSRIVHHRYMLFSEKIIQNIAKNFNLSFLFLAGDDNLRHQTGEFGLLYHWEFFVIVVGIYLAMKKKNYSFAILVLWILIAVLPPAVTTVSPHTLRFLSASPAFSLFSAVGVVFLLESVRQYKRIGKIVVLLFAAIIIGEFVMYSDYYFRFYATASASEWQYGYKELYSSLKELQKENEQVFVTREQGRPAMYYAFFNSIDPEFVQSESKTVPKDQQELLQLGTYSFVDAISQTPDNGLYATSPDHKPEQAVLLKEISLPDGKVIWNIWRLGE